MANTEINKKSAVEFLQLVIDGEIDQAYERFVDMTGKHHNMYFPAGFQSLREAMKENHKQMPDKRIIIKHVIGENDVAMVHSHIITEPGTKGLAAVHIFRFANGKIVEMWDCVQIVPEDMPNTDGGF